jgi:glycosyltransferase involved in cell wall biosynthesis
VLINTSDSYGGAAIAAFRYGEMLSKLKNIDLNLVVNEKKIRKNWVFGFDKNIIQRLFNFLRFCFERLSFWVIENNKSVRFAFSPGNIGRSIHKLDLLKNADIIHLHWVNKAYLSIDELGKLTKLNKVVFWTLHDMWSFTGGCHHNRGCDNFINECGRCQYLDKRYQGGKDISNSILKEKINKLDTSNLILICPSEWLASLARKSKLFSSTRIYVLPNPVDTSVFKVEDKKNAKLKLGLDPEKKYLLFVAANISNEFKGIKYLYEAINELSFNPELQNSIELLVVGGSKSTNDSQLKLKAHNLGYISNQDLMVQIYNAADIFITPSLEENLPNTIMEAMSCGVPCVGFDIGGIPELIDHKITGYVSSYKDVGDLVIGIKYCLEDHDRYRLLSSNSRSKVTLKYSYDEVGKRLVNLYKKALNTAF